MIKFFRDVLDGPLYIVITILSIIFIMAIIGFLMERKKLEKEAKKKIAVVDMPPMNQTQEVTPIEPVAVQAEQETITTAQQPVSISDLPQEESSSLEVKEPVIVFEDPDQKTE